MNVSGNIADVVAGTIYPGTLEIHDGVIVDIVRETRRYDTYIIPGLIDSHVHIESSMLVPSEFARLAVSHGMIGAVCDPHEIANVLGVEGVRYMMENADTVPFKFFFGAPSCVPATPFETSGAKIGVPETEILLKDSRIVCLGEMMNFPGVINGDDEVAAKINIAGRYNKPVDGHAPGLRGDGLKRYVRAGITTDHECSGPEEAREKIALGMKILIREGSAARNFDALSPLIGEFPHACMFCSDDMHPDDLVMGGINLLVKRAVQKGFGVMKVLRCASLNPVAHYRLDVGLLQKGQSADFVVVDNLSDFTVLKTVIGGETVSERRETCIVHRVPAIINRFSTLGKNAGGFRITVKGKRGPRDRSC
jgi:adenine deaminase